MKGIFRKSSKQQGIYIVEFTIVASLFFLLIFAIIEFGRLLFTWHTLNEISRRTARLASVCYITNAEQNDIITKAILNNVTLPNFTVNNIELNYLNETGGAVDTPLDDPSNFNEIEFVEAKIKDYQLNLIIPFDFFGFNFFAPEFSTLLPRESLGVTRFKDKNTPELKDGITDC